MTTETNETPTPKRREVKRKRRNPTDVKIALREVELILTSVQHDVVRLQEALEGLKATIG